MARAQKARGRGRLWLGLERQGAARSRGYLQARVRSFVVS